MRRQSVFALTAAFAVLASLLVLPLGATHAAGTAAPLGPDGELCRFQTEHQGRLGNLPEDLLTAISHVESGRYDQAREAKTAWPWTVMAEGRGRYFPTKAQAIKAVRALQARGVRNIDVGCMQINLFYHGDAFPDLDAAFDPATNVAYAVNFLQGLKRETGSWTKATTRYHSATPEYARRYRGKVNAELAALANQAPGAWTSLADGSERTDGLSTPQRQAVAAHRAQVAAARTEADAQRAAARKFAEDWRTRRLAEYREAKAARTTDDDAS